MQLATFLLILEDYMLPCLTKKVLGFDCPGCGLQRSLSFLIQGNFTDAFYSYPALFALIPLFSLLLADALFKIKFAKRITNILALVAVGLVLVNYILKFI